VREGDWKLIGAEKGEPDFLANLADPEPEGKITSKNSRQSALTYSNSTTNG